MVAPTEVPNGEGCGCVCPGCNVSLVAKQGTINEWHFAHAKGADCANATESALHRMAKQLIMDRQQVFVPERKLEQRANGPYDDVSGEYSWREVLSVEIQAEGLVNLFNCAEEQRVETRRPDVLAYIGGSRIAIEVAFTHFCDAQKLEWLIERNLTTIEIDIGLPPDTPLAEIRAALEMRLFETATYSAWLYHAGDIDALKQLEENERRLRLSHVETDRAFEAILARRKADRKRKDEFKAQIREIDACTIRLNRGLTVRVAYSEIRCTMEGQEYFDANNDRFKQLILDTAMAFKGRYNEKYGIWEFRRPPDEVFPLYRSLLEGIRQRLTELQEQKATPTRDNPAPTSSHRFRDEDEQELFEELAAIKEFEGGMPRGDAERSAFVEILKRRVNLDRSLPF